MDIAYIPMERGFVYLFGVIDWYSRYLLGWRLSNTLSADFCIETVKDCISQYGKPQIINTDQGTQFTCDEFTSMVLGQEIKLSMDGRGRATDNIAIERFWRSLKYEHIYLYAYEGVRELSRGIGRYVTFYNHERKHQELDYKTPAQLYRKSVHMHTTQVSMTAFST